MISFWAYKHQVTSTEWFRAYKHRVVIRHLMASISYCVLYFSDRLVTLSNGLDRTLCYKIWQDTQKWFSEKKYHTIINKRLVSPIDWNKLWSFILGKSKCNQIMSSWNLNWGSFLNYVDEILRLFDHLPTYGWNLY